MSHLQLDGDTLGRLLARAGVTVSVDGRGVALGGAGWEAVVERLQVEATVRVGGIGLRVTGVEIGGEGVGVGFRVGDG